MDVTSAVTCRTFSIRLPSFQAFRFTLVFLNVCGAFADLTFGVRKLASDAIWTPPTLPPLPTLPPPPAPFFAGLPLMEYQPKQDDAENLFDHSKQNRSREENVRTNNGRDSVQGGLLSVATTASKPPKVKTTTTVTAQSTTTTSTTVSTTSVTTTTTNTCSSRCTVNEVEASCKEHIQQTSLADYLGDRNSCSKAQAVIANQCPSCSGCPAHEAGCGVLELAPTPTPTSPAPRGGGCKAICVLGGQPATCTARITWSAQNVFGQKVGACSQAHAMVLDQCPVCGHCGQAETQCMDPSMLKDQRYHREVFRQKFESHNSPIYSPKTSRLTASAMLLLVGSGFSLGVVTFVVGRKRRREWRHYEAGVVSVCE